MMSIAKHSIIPDLIRDLPEEKADPRFRGDDGL
jgi:hypothetical protein